MASVWLLVSICSSPREVRRTRVHLALAFAYLQSAGSFLFLLAAAAVVGIALNAYTNLAATGALGLPAQQKLEVQGTGRYGILLGGRPEVLLSVRAIVDSPLIGHGILARLPEDSILRVAGALRQLGYVELSSVLADQELTRAHSHLFGAWMEAGLAGALFWIAVLVLVIRSLLRGLKVLHPLGVLASFIGSSTFSSCSGMCSSHHSERTGESS